MSTRGRTRRRPGVADLPAFMLPALIFLGLIIYTAWANFWDTLP